MSDNTIRLEINNRPLTIEVNKIGKQADGSALVRYGETVMFVAATSKKEAREPRPFFPLTVDYRENTYASGKIPGGFFKREGRPSEKEVLMCRLIDRPIRSLMPDGYFSDTHIVAMLLSADLDNEPDTLALIGASAALYLSDIPFTTPIGAVKLGCVDGRFIVNPTVEEREKSTIEMVVVATEEGIVVIEAGGDEIDEKKFLEAVTISHEPIQKIIQAQKDLFNRMNIQKRAFSVPELDQEKFARIEQKFEKSLREAMLGENQNIRKDLFRKIQEDLVADYPEENEDEIREAKEILYQVQKKLVRKMILNERKRADGRDFDEIRPLSIEVGMLPRTHGSALFTRGETQCLATVTLGTPEDVQRVDGLGENMDKHFMLHYNFPPFSVGEAGFLRGPGRRDIGHGALAEKAIRPAIPRNEEEFPYTIRIVSEVLESNGSSSMATVCGGVLSLMDAGVPLTLTVAGIAMGLVTEGDRYEILTDIAGLEDHVGDMDLKVAGSEKGITALQMDLKIPSISLAMLAEGLEKARLARLKVLAKMKEAISQPRPEISPYAPRIINLFVNPSRVGEVIGPAGKIIKKIIAETNTKIDIDDTGKITIASADMEAVKKAEGMIRDITAEAEVGKTYEGKVVRLEEYGAFVQILPNQDGLLHISEISRERVRNIRDVLKLGQMLHVKVISIDENNKIRLSKKALESGPDSSSGGEEGGRNRESSSHSNRDRNSYNPDRNRNKGSSYNRDHNKNR